MIVRTMKRAVCLVLFTVLMVAWVIQPAYAAAAIFPSNLVEFKDEAFYISSLTEIEIPDSVQRIGHRAFARCPKLKTVIFPDHDIDIADDAFDGSDVCFYAYVGTNIVSYAEAHDIPVVFLSSSLQITSVEADMAQTAVGSSATWIAQTAGSQGQVNYQYTLVKDGTVISQSGYSDRNYFAYVFPQAGAYAVIVSCYDDTGVIVEETSETVTVLPMTAKMISVQDDGQAAAANDVIRWTCKVSSSTGSAMFDYVLLYNGEVIDRSTGNKETSYAYAAVRPGTYVLEVTCKDNGSITTAASVPVVICSQEEAYPSAPQLIPTKDMTAPSAQADTAPTLVPGDILLVWNAVAAAKYYGVELQKLDAESADGGDWMTIYVEPIVEETKCQLTSDLFAGVAVQTQYRVALSSVGVRSGEASYWYFNVAPAAADQRIWADGLLTAYWDQVGKQANSRFFEVQSELPWTASVDVDWLEVSVDKTGVTVNMLESIYYHDVHVGTVTLNNGVNTAKIIVTRDSSSNNVTLDNHNWSKNESSATKLPVGGVYLEITHNYEKLALTIYEKQNDGMWQQVYTAFVDDKIALQDTVGGYTFKGNTDYRFTFTGHVTEDRWQTAEVASEIPATHFYVYMTENGHAITVDEKKDQLMTIIDSLRLSVDATNLWTVTENADWLTADIDDRYYRDVDLNAQPNYTGADRKAEVVFTCGNAQVTLTLTQRDMTPKLLFPTNLSQNQSAPTLITDNQFAYKYIGNTMQFYYQQNGEFIKDETNWEHISPFGISGDTWLVEYFEPNLLYKLEISDDAGKATSYYVKFEKASSAYVTINDLGLYEWEAPGIASQTTVTLAASGTWKASSDSAWLKVSSASGSKTSGKTLTISVLENTTDAPRTGTITFTRGSDDTAYIQVTQDVASAYLAIYDKEKETITEDSMITDVLDGDKQTYDIYVYTEDEWTVSDDASWISTKITNNRVRLTISENAVGGSLRAGTVTVKTASAKCALTVQQAVKLAAPVVSWNVSTDYKNPSVLIKEDQTLSWKPVAGAAYYNVFFASAEPDGYVYYGSQVMEDGRSSYTYTLPEKWLQVYAADYCYLEVEAVDAYGHKEPSEQFSFYITDNPKAILNGSSAPKWLNDVDVPVSKKFTVSSVGSWTAAARQSWISLDVTQGVSGDILTVSLEDNTGAARSGQVSVVCGGYETVLNITQCGMLEEYPSLLTPALSEDYISPTVMPTDTTSITVTWDQAAQAKYYRVFLEEMKPDGGWKTVSDSKYMSDAAGAYTFQNLNLTAGQMYRIHFVRSCDRYGATGNTYYILADAAESFVLADGESKQLFDAYGDEDVESYRITSGGAWTAESSADWIMVASHSVDQDELNEDGYSSTYYSTYLGRPNTNLVISLLANPTKAIRRGTVTLRSGSASMVIDVSQDPYYDAARIVSPVLGETSSAANEMKLGSLALSWSSAEGGTGVYRVTLDAYDEEDRDYYEVYEEKNITSCSLTIPSSVLQENTKYFLCLYTEVEGLDYDVKETYYFRTSSKDALVINGNANWDFACVNGYVDVSMNASGGTGTYQYAYELLCNGEQCQMTAWGDWKQYRFAIGAAGKYQVRFHVSDSAGNVNTALSAECAVTEQPAEENDGTFTITGYVLASGKPVAGAYVYVLNAQGSIVRSTCSTDDGEWQLSKLDKDGTYSVVCEKEGYTFTRKNGVTSSQEGTPLQMTGSLVVNSDTSAAIPTFTMSASQISTGEAVILSVKAPQANRARLVVDGVAYEWYSVQDGVCTIKRVFNKEGKRTVQIQMGTFDKWGSMSDAQTLVVTAAADLEEPVLYGASMGNIGQPYKVGWNRVKNADCYMLYLYCNDRRIIPHSGAEAEKLTGTSWTIPSELIAEPGEYTVELVAAGYGYNQSSKQLAFTVPGAAGSARLNGSIVDERGAGVAGVTVSVFQMVGEHYDFVTSVQTNTDGSWKVQGLHAGTRYYYLYHKESHIVDHEGDRVLNAGANTIETVTAQTLGDGPLYTHDTLIEAEQTPKEYFITIYSPDAWTSTSNVEWISFDNGLQASSYPVTQSVISVFVDENAGEERQGIITVACDGYKIEIVVNQHSAETLTARSRNGFKTTKNGTPILSQGEARKLMNFLAGRDVITKGGFLWLWYKQAEGYETYWKLITGKGKFTAAEEKLCRQAFVQYAVLQISAIANYEYTNNSKYKAAMQYSLDYVNGKLDNVNEEVWWEVHDQLVDMLGLDNGFPDAEDTAFFISALTANKIRARVNAGRYMINKWGKFKTIISEWDAMINSAELLQYGDSGTDPWPMTLDKWIDYLDDMDKAK